MGMSRKRKDAFYAKHPYCIFCGGSEKATTIEHCPPRAMFQKRDWPEGFEFPACADCNHGTADCDLIVALLARTDPFTDAGNKDGRMDAIIGSVDQKYPGLIRKMMPTANQAKRINQRLGIAPPAGGTAQETGAIHVTEEIHHAVEIFAAKLTKAVYYLHTDGALPPGRRLALKWFTNQELFTNNGRYAIFDSLQELAGVAPDLRRAKSFLNDQFSYKLSRSADSKSFVLQAAFGNGFGFLVIGATEADVLEPIFANLEKRTGKPNFLKFL